MKQATDDIEKLMTVEEVAETLHCSKSHVRNLIADEKLPSIRIGRLVRVTRTALRSYIESLVEA